mmetsp:Transcript_9426/g.21534  ORF Transcript_9426/g.21534 Transcript_9426/m.21534 type:complete len:298 (+) Transcript_9426:189-1082(+)
MTTIGRIVRAKSGNVKIMKSLRGIVHNRQLLSKSCRCNLLAVEVQESLDNSVGGFNLRVVANIWEPHNHSIRNELCEPISHVRPADWVQHSIDEQELHSAFHQRSGPPILVENAVCHVGDCAICHAVPVLVRNQTPVVVHFLMRWLGVGTKDAGETACGRLLQCRARKDCHQDWAHVRVEQRTLDQQWLVRFRKQAAVQQHKAFQLHSQTSSIVSSQNFLSYSVSIVVCHCMKAGHTQPTQYSNMNIGLLPNAVGMMPGFVAETKPERIDTNNTEPFRKLVPDRNPVEGGSWKPMNE